MPMKNLNEKMDDVLSARFDGDEPKAHLFVANIATPDSPAIEARKASAEGRDSLSTWEGAGGYKYAMTDEGNIRIVDAPAGAAKDVEVSPDSVFGVAILAEKNSPAVFAALQEAARATRDVEAGGTTAAEKARYEEAHSGPVEEFQMDKSSYKTDPDRRTISQSTPGKAPVRRSVVVGSMDSPGGQKVLREKRKRGL
jgi:hypothetical protein